jgi:DNA repair protein RadC
MPATRAALDDLALLRRALGDRAGEEVLDRFRRGGGCGSLVGLPPAELRERLALQPRAARRLAAGIELGRRAVCAELGEGCVLRSGREVWRFLAPRLAGERVECFRALYLDAKGRLLHEEAISSGTLTASLVHPREVFGPALVRRAAAVVVGHNHPSGDPEPSEEDRATTRRLVRAGRLLGIELLDHVVCGAGRYVSFLERGWL